MGNCLDKTVSSSSDESDENMVDTRASRPRRRTRTNSTNRYQNLVNSSSSLSSNRSIINRNSQNYPFSQSVNLNSGDSSSSSFLSSSLPNPVLPSSFSSSQQVYYLSPNVQRTADQLTEEEQIKLLKRMTLIQQLPSGAYDENKKNKECVICMIDFEKNDTIKYLPCMHTFHQSCIDTWLLRSLICPSCMEPVDAGLLTAYE